MKKGRMSKHEWNFIETNAEKKSASEIAKLMGRDIETVLLHLKKIGKSPNKKGAFEVQAEYDIKSRPFWGDLKKQFSSEELDLFLYHWKQIIAQFRKDVTSTEEMQIIDAIKMEVLMTRALIEQQQTISQVSQLEAQLSIEEYKPAAERDKELYFSLQRQIASLRAAKEALGRDYKELQSKKSALIKDLKGTRDQRVQKLESDKRTFSGLIGKLLADPDFFAEQGRQMELMRLASINVRAELGSYHTYSDGVIDIPLLTPESVMDKE
jgi:hypothetical protein